MKLIFTTTILILAISFHDTFGKAKDLTFKGKGKNNEAFDRQQLCLSICSNESNGEKTNKKNELKPWIESHQICACWDKPEYRENIKKEGCKPEKNVLVYLLNGEAYTCNQMCKKYITDITSNEKVRLREAFMCSVKMMFGYTSTCICDYKLAI